MLVPRDSKEMGWRIGRDVPSVNPKPRLLDLHYVSVDHNVVIYINLIVLHNQMLDIILSIDKITARIASWTSKVLSFAGRLQLIQSVLFSIQAFGLISLFSVRRLYKPLNKSLLAFYGCNYFPRSVCSKLGF